MFSDDGEYFKRIKSLLEKGTLEENTEKITMSSEGDILVEVLDPETQSPSAELKQKITQAMSERPEFLVNPEDKITPTYDSGSSATAAAATPAPLDSDMDIRFATKFIASGGKFLYCESMKEAMETLQMLKDDYGWGYVFTWENEIKDAFTEYGFQKGALGFTIENSDAAISLCECLVADEGIVILNPKQASRRRLPCFPKVQILLADVSCLVGSEADGLNKFYKAHKGQLPSFIKLGECNTGHFYDKQRLILNAEGPEDLFIILIDEFIPPSTRP